VMTQENRARIEALEKEKEALEEDRGDQEEISKNVTAHSEGLKLQISALTLASWCKVVEDDPGQQSRAGGKRKADAVTTLSDRQEKLDEDRYWFVNDVVKCHDYLGTRPGLGGFPLKIQERVEKFLKDITEAEALALATKFDLPFPKSKKEAVEALMQSKFLG
jgi:hypothetical protein